MTNGEKLLFNSHYLEKDCYGGLCAELWRVGKSCCVLCIGCADIAYDALGPTCGSYISRGCDIPVYGTLDKPVDASNLGFVLDRIRYFHSDMTLLAIDSMKSAGDGFGNIVLLSGGIVPARQSRLFSCRAGDYAIGAVTASYGNIYAAADEIDSMAKIIAGAVQFAVYGAKY